MRPRISSQEAIERRLGGIARSSLRRLGIRRGTAAVILTTGAKLKRLKAAYYTKKKRSGDPDVLSFSERRDFPHPEAPGRFFGEIYLNKKFTSEPKRLEFLLIHGLLHLLGYSHDGKRDTLKMQSLEKKLMRTH